MKEKKFTSSMEDHLKAIYWLIEENGYARGSQIAQFLGHKPASVTQMLVKLRKEGLIKHEKYGIIHLTPAGKEMAQQLHQKHNTLVSLLKLLGVDGKIAEVDGCRIEHVISPETMERLIGLVEALELSSGEGYTSP
jgi:DtxR family Mn-dependent transcriptional regulator